MAKEERDKKLQINDIVYHIKAKMRRTRADVKCYRTEIDAAAAAQCRAHCRAHCRARAARTHSGWSRSVPSGRM